MEVEQDAMLVFICRMVTAVGAEWAARLIAPWLAVGRGLREDVFGEGLDAQDAVCAGPELLVIVWERCRPLKRHVGMCDCRPCEGTRLPV
jgi:hypothetical protein